MSKFIYIHQVKCEPKEAKLTTQYETSKSHLDRLIVYFTLARDIAGNLTERRIFVPVQSQGHLVFVIVYVNLLCCFTVCFGSFLCFGV